MANGQQNVAWNPIYNPMTPGTTWQYPGQGAAWQGGGIANQLPWQAQQGGYGAVTSEGLQGMAPQPWPWMQQYGQGVYGAVPGQQQQATGFGVPGMGGVGQGVTLPWADWEQRPWATVPGGEQQQAMAWMNVMLPWLQQQAQQEQFGAQQQFQHQQFGWQQQQDEWARQFQQQQLEQQQALEQARMGTEQEIANVQTFGRRWKPQTRWM